MLLETNGDQTSYMNAALVLLIKNNIFVRTILGGNYWTLPGFDSSEY